MIYEIARKLGIRFDCFEKKKGQIGRSFVVAANVSKTGRVLLRSLLSTFVFGTALRDSRTARSSSSSSTVLEVRFCKKIVPVVIDSLCSAPFLCNPPYKLHRSIHRIIDQGSRSSPIIFHRGIFFLGGKGQLSSSFILFFFSILFIRSFDYSNKNSSTIFFPQSIVNNNFDRLFFYNPHENIECLELISKEIRIVLETRSRQKSGRIERRASRVSTSHFIDHFDRIVENGFPPRQTPSYRLL